MDGKDVAAKTFKYKRDARDERKIIEHLDHVNVVQFMGETVHKNKIYLVYELCARSLKDELRLPGNGKGLRCFDLVGFISDFLLGYSYIRDRGICHNDIKTDNILVGMDGRYKIADFGLSTYASDGDLLSMVAGTEITPMQK